VGNTFIEGVNGRLRDEGLTVHHFTFLDEEQTKDEAWRRGEKQHRPHGAHGHPTPIVFVAQPQASRVAEEVACSGLRPAWAESKQGATDYRLRFRHSHGGTGLWDQPTSLSATLGDPSLALPARYPAAHTSDTINTTLA
jgi:hypothetical protein